MGGHSAHTPGPAGEAEGCRPGTGVTLRPHTAMQSREHSQQEHAAEPQARERTPVKRLVSPHMRREKGAGRQEPRPGGPRWRRCRRLRGTRSWGAGGGASRATCWAPARAPRVRTHRPHCLCLASVAVQPRTCGTAQSTRVLGTRPRVASTVLPARPVVSTWSGEATPHEAHARVSPSLSRVFR